MKLPHLKADTSRKDIVIMTRSEFVELIKEKTTKELASWQNLKDTKISVIKLPLQGKSLYIIEADYADRTVSVNLSKYYNLYENEITNTSSTPDDGISFMDVIANQIVSEIQEKLTEPDELTEDDISDMRSDILESTVIGIVNKDHPIAKHDFLVYKDICDMRFIYYSDYTDLGLPVIDTARRKEELKQYDIPFSELDAEALKNTEQAHPACITQSEKHGRTVCHITSGNEPFGAVALFYPDTLSKISRILPGDFFLLPYNTHEFYAIGFTNEEKETLKKSLKKALSEINQKMHESHMQDMILSENIYVYDSEEGSLQAV